MIILFITFKNNFNIVYNKNCIFILNLIYFYIMGDNKHKIKI